MIPIPHQLSQLLDVGEEFVPPSMGMLWGLGPISDAPSLWFLSARFGSGALGVLAIRKHRPDPSSQYQDYVCIYIYIHHTLYISGWWFGTWLLFSISYMGCHPCHWQTHIFQDGYCTTNQLCLYILRYNITNISCVAQVCLLRCEMKTQFLHWIPPKVTIVVVSKELVAFLHLNSRPNMIAPLLLWFSSHVWWARRLPGGVCNAKSFRMLSALFFWKMAHFYMIYDDLPIWWFPSFRKPLVITTG